jgi:hypothetical protein
MPPIIVAQAKAGYHFVSHQAAISRKRKAKGIAI